MKTDRPHCDAWYRYLNDCIGLWTQLHLDVTMLVVLPQLEDVDCLELLAE